MKENLFSETLVASFSLLLIYLLFRWFLKSRHFAHGYKTALGGIGVRTLTKNYHFAKVTFYNWGSSDTVANGDDTYTGTYGTIISSKDVSLEDLRSIFDECEMEEHQGKFIITMKKRNIYLGSEEMKNILMRIDRIMK